MTAEPNKDAQPLEPKTEQPIVRVGITDHLPPLPPLTQPSDPTNGDTQGSEPIKIELQASEPLKVDTPKKNDTSPKVDSFSFRPDAKPDPTRDTAVLSENNPILKRLIRATSPSGTASLGMGREVILVIRGMVERIVMEDNKIYKLGRFEIGTRKAEEIDLSPYGALDRGVSRVHSQLQMMGEHLYIMDLTSTNGTYLAGQRLKPNEPTLLRKGDELLIGRLPVQVLFR